MFSTVEIKDHECFNKFKRALSLKILVTHDACAQLCCQTVVYINKFDRIKPSQYKFLVYTHFMKQRPPEVSIIYINNIFIMMKASYKQIQ